MRNPASLAGVLIALACCRGLSPAADAVAEGNSAPRYTNERSQRWQIGVVVRAGAGPVSGIVATMPVPMPWPEQDVRTVNQEASHHVHNVQVRDLDETARQLVVTIPRLAAGEEARAVVTVEILKRDIVAPAATGQLRIPSSVPRELRKYLAASPFIDVQDRKIRQITPPVIAEARDAWGQAEAIYDWVRANVEYRFDTQIKEARQALDDGYGDCEELTSLFVAMCRVAKIPARAVWVPGHCYPEFYLEDEDGQGHWFPCQAAGSRAFGAMPEARPILQKGDNIRVPGSRQPQRYVQEALTAKHAAADPAVQFIQKPLED
ncbi:MAG: transglutaminase domain-containing protein [Planctomycetes bacterium]|nr:transglutaminase domain-containing protein [Planctomycetota bacterium]